MADFIEHLTGRLHKEIRYGRGMICMYRERQEVYQDDLHQALRRGDWNNAAMVAQDLAAFL
jgi:hypothetical protein